MPCSRRCAAGPDAVAHQHRRRMDAAEADDDLLAGKLLRLPGDLGRHADGFLAVEFDARRGRARNDRQIRPRAHARVEIADRRGRALVRPVADRHHRIAVAEIRVHVHDGRKLPLGREAFQHLRQRRPLLLGHAAHRHRPVVAVQLAAVVEILFELLEERQHVVPAPAFRAERFPFGVVVGRAAQRHHAHHRRAAAHDAALRIAGERRIAGEPPVHLQLGPEIGRVVVGGRIGIEHVGGLFAGRRVLPGFEQQHLVPRARRKPVRQHAARGAAANDDGVVALTHAAASPERPRVRPLRRD